MNRRTLIPRLAVVGLALALAAGALWAVALAANIIVCTGGPCSGTESRDEITGTDGADQISALGGFDYVEGGDGDDELNGGAGQDELYGGVGADVYHGGDGWDFMQEGDNVVSNDVIEGGANIDAILGGGGDDLVVGGDGDDSFGADANLRGGPGNDVLYGDNQDGTGDGDDGLEGEGGNDTYFAGAGDDFIFAHFDESRRGKDEIHCGPGVDEVVANRNDTVFEDSGNDDVCEVVHLVRNPKKATKAERRAATVAQERWQAEFLARRDADR